MTPSEPAAETKKQFHRQGYINPIPTTDCVMRYHDGVQKGIVLIERAHEPFGIALPGGFAEFGLTFEENAVKEAREETGLEFRIENPGRPYVFSDPCRDPRGHLVSITYVGTGEGTLKAGDDAKAARLYTIPEIKELIFNGQLAFDHGAILTAVLKEEGMLIDAEKIRAERGTLGTVGVLGRFKPLHHGGAALLESLCEQADGVVIGIGSANKYDARNPFTMDETQEMIDAHLKAKGFSNYTFVPLNDYGKAEGYSTSDAWKENVRAAFGHLDFFVSGNAYVGELLGDAYRVAHPMEMVTKERWNATNATTVRAAMAAGEPWEQHVPEPVAEYIHTRQLVERFTAEFGAAARGAAATRTNGRPETLGEQMAHTVGEQGE